MNLHQFRCFYKVVDKKSGRMRLIELPTIRIKVQTGVMGHIFRLAIGKPIMALQRIDEHYRQHVRAKLTYSLTPEALAFVGKEAAKGSRWRNIHNDEFVLYLKENAELLKTAA